MGLAVTEASFSFSVLDGAVAHTPEIDEVRRAAFNLVRTGTAPRVSRIAATTGQRVEEVRDIVDGLVTAGIATVEGDPDGDLAVVGADGLTVNVTPHQLVLDGQPLHTWCAFDTVGIPAALGADAVARSSCPTCGAAIELVLRKGQPPDDPVVGWWPQATSGPVNESFCPAAHLFCSREHLASWRATSNAGPGEALPLAALAERARATWSLFTDSGDGR